MSEKMKLNRVNYILKYMIFPLLILFFFKYLFKVFEHIRQSVFLSLFNLIILYWSIIKKKWHTEICKNKRDVRASAIAREIYRT